MDAADVAVTNTDNDTAGISVIPTSGLTTTEGGGTATLTVVLTRALHPPAVPVCSIWHVRAVTSSPELPSSPLTVTDMQMNQALDIIDEAIADVAAQKP